MCQSVSDHKVNKEVYRFRSVQTTMNCAAFDHCHTGMDGQTLDFVKKYTYLTVVKFDECVCMPFHFMNCCWPYIGS